MWRRRQAPILKGVTNMIVAESRELTYKIEDVMLKLTNDINHLDFMIQMKYPSPRDAMTMESEGRKLFNELRDKKDAYYELELMNHFYKKGTLTDSGLRIFSNGIEKLIGVRFDGIKKSKLTRKTLSSPHLMGPSDGR